MACFKPLTAYRNLQSGAISFFERGDVRELRIPCGQCIGCRLERSRQNAIRCVHESQMHDVNVFITLTYNQDSGSVYSLCYRDFQLFMKKLRKKYGKVRFYMAGEYGEHTRRPHFHALLFGVDFTDKVFFKRSDSGSNVYVSKILTDLWGHGFASVGDVTFESAAYVARYIVKKVTGDLADDHYVHVDLLSGEVHKLVPEFTHMSLKPGIGYTWFRKYCQEVYPHDRVVIRGMEMKPPRAYDRLLKRLNPVSVMPDEVEYERYLKSLSVAEHSTSARLAVREQVAHARLTFKKRSL